MTNPPTLGAYVRERRDYVRPRLTQRALARLLGRSQRWVSGLEMDDGSPPEDAILVQIADAIEGDLAEMRLLSGRNADGAEPEPEERDPDAPIQLADRRAERGGTIEDRGLTIPIVSGEQLVAFIRGEFNLERAYGPLPRRVGRRLVASRVAGDGLQPDVLPDDLVIVDLDREPQPGRLVLAIQDSDAYVKRFEAPGDDEGPATTSDEAEVLGVVVQLRRDLGGPTSR